MVRAYRLRNKFISPNIALVALFLFDLGARGTPAPPQSSRTDNSDWWSGLNAQAPEENIKPQEREPSPSNFRILGIDLDDGMFKRAARKLGKATEVMRGDASSGRDQVCYMSVGNSEKVHLIFEQGEADYSFYLFMGGADWSGSNQCLPSKLVSVNLSTASGLRLGQTPAQVMAILGKPSVRRKKELVYSFLVRKRNSVEDLKKARDQNPEMSEKDFHANYDFYDLGVGIDARFVGSKLTFLAVSKSETT